MKDLFPLSVAGMSLGWANGGEESVLVDFRWRCSGLNRQSTVQMTTLIEGTHLMVENDIL